jgi:hypothetical protein
LELLTSSRPIGAHLIFGLLTICPSSVLTTY